MQVPFIGRHEELSSFQSACVEAGEGARGTPAARHYQNVRGPRGIGKSALADHLHRSMKQAERVAAVLVTLEEIDQTDVFQMLADLRRDLGGGVPCPRFEAAFSLYIAQCRPREFAAKRWSVGPVDPDEVFKKAIENGSKKGIEEIVAQLSSGALGGAAAGIIAGAMTTALVGASVAIGSYLTLLLARSYVVGMLARIRDDALLRSSPRLRNLAVVEPRTKVATFRRDLPLLLAEDLNAASAASERSRIMGLLIDPIDALNDPNDARAEVFAQALMRLVSALDRGLVLTFGRERSSSWELGCARLAADGSPFGHLYTCEHRELQGLLEQEVLDAVSNSRSPGTSAVASIGPTLSALPRLPDGTISPQEVVAHWGTLTL